MTVLSFSLRFGSLLLMHQPCAMRSLTHAKMRKESRKVKVVIRGQLFPGSVDFRDNRVFPHDTMLP